MITINTPRTSVSKLLVELRSQQQELQQSRAHLASKEKDIATKQVNTIPRPSRLAGAGMHLVGSLQMASMLQLWLASPYRDVVVKITPCLSNRRSCFCVVFRVSGSWALLSTGMRIKPFSSFRRDSSRRLKRSFFTHCYGSALGTPH